MGKSFEEMNTYEKLEKCYKCMMEGEFNSSFRNYFWELNSIIYNYTQKNKLIIQKSEISKIKFFNLKLMRACELPDYYLNIIKNFTDLGYEIIANETNSGTTI